MSVLQLQIALLTYSALLQSLQLSSLRLFIKMTHTLTIRQVRKIAVRHSGNLVLHEIRLRSLAFPTRFFTHVAYVFSESDQIIYVTSLLKLGTSFAGVEAK